MDRYLIQRAYRHQAQSLATLLLLACWLALSPPSAAAAFVVDPASSDQPIGVSMTVLADPDDRFQAADVLAGDHIEATVAHRQSPPSLGYPRHPYWTRIELRNDSNATLERLLVLWRGSTHRQQVSVEVQVDGAAPEPVVSSIGQDINIRHSVVRLRLPPQSTTTIASRLSSNTALGLDYRLLTDISLAAVDRVDYWFFGLLTGVVAAIAIYLFALYFALRERLYLLFCGFAMGNIFYQLHTEGYLYTVIPEAWRPAGNMAGTLSGATFAILVVLFVRDYTRMPDLSPKVDRWLLRPVLIIVALVFVVLPFAPWLGNTIGALGVLAAIAVSAFAALYGSLRTRTEWSFLLAMLIFFASGVAHLLKRIGVLPDLQAIALVPQIGAALTTIAFAAAVMQRIKRMADAQRQAQAGYADRLMREVAEKTLEMRQAKELAESSLNALQTTQRQLIDAEKMASLGQLVAGVAHEVNTPLGIAITASSHLAERGQALSARLADNTLGRGELEAFINESRDTGAMVGRNLERAAHLIRSFKQVSVDRTSDGRRRFDLEVQINELIDSLRMSWKRRPVTLTVQCPAGITLDSFPGALGQILTNFVQNALLHAFEPADEGHIRIHCRELADQRVELVFEDDGKGLDQETLARIFDPFFTTKRNAGGTGLGLNIAYNLAAQKLQGTLAAWSSPDKGLRLTLVIPKAPSTTDSGPRGETQ